MQLILYLVREEIRSTRKWRTFRSKGGGGHCSLIVVAFIEKDVKKLNEMEFLHLA